MSGRSNLGQRLRRKLRRQAFPTGGEVAQRHDRDGRFLSYVTPPAAVVVTVTRQQKRHEERRAAKAAKALEAVKTGGGHASE